MALPLCLKCYLSLAPVLEMVNICVDVSPVNKSSLSETGETEMSGGSNPSTCKQQSQSTHPGHHW